MSDESLGHLRLLSIFHFVYGGMVALFSLIWLIYVALGVFMATSPDFVSSKGLHEAPPEAVGWIISGFGLVLIFIGWAVATLLIIAGRNLSRQRHHTYCMVIAAMACLFVPLGTVLGVFTLVVLTKPEVKELFDRKGQQAPGSSGV
jgi:hypothetical protein